MLNITSPLVPARVDPQHGGSSISVISWDDATWIMTSSFIIFTMQSGFGLLESGCVNRKNEVNIMVKNAVDVIFGGLGYWMFGYAFSFGKDAGSNFFIGIGGFFLDAQEKDMGAVFATYIFQLSFATTATTIVSGAMAERCNFLAYCLFSFFNTIIFSLPAGWLWNDKGFLRTLNVVDIAGCSAVHLVGGASALVAAMMLKPRLGRYEDGGQAPPMGSPTNALVGMFMLWWGWLGFNCGSTFGVSGHKWKYAARSAIVTINSTVGGGLAALLFSYVIRRRKFLVTDIITGILASLVAITGGCALYHPWEAIFVGLFGSLLANAAMPLLDWLHIDDPVGAISVHGVGSVWGMLAVGLFVERDTLLELSKGHTGFFRGGGMYLLGVQVLAVLVVALWSMVTTFLLLSIINKVIPIRMTPEEEKAGADLVEHNIHYEIDASILSKLDMAAIKSLRMALDSNQSDPLKNREREKPIKLNSATQTEVVIRQEGSCSMSIGTREDPDGGITEAWISDDEKIASVHTRKYSRYYHNIHPS